MRFREDALAPGCCEYRRLKALREVEDLSRGESSAKPNPQGEPLTVQETGDFGDTARVALGPWGMPERCEIRRRDRGLYAGCQAQVCSKACRTGETILKPA